MLPFLCSKTIQALLLLLCWSTSSSHALVPLHLPSTALTTTTTASVSDPLALLSLVEHTTSLVATKLSTTYTSALAQHPLVTKMATGGILATVGDGIAQAQEVDKPYDTRRALSFMVFDIAYRALQQATFPLIIHSCQGQYLGSLVGSTVLPTEYAAAIEQTLVNQLGIVPLIYYPVFFSLSGFVQGLSVSAALQRAKDKFIPLMKRNLAFWIPIQFFQFGFLPEDLQISFLCVAGLCWTCILSVAAGSTTTPTTPEEKALQPAVAAAATMSTQTTATVPQE